jgi:hypothetical protein
VVSRTVAKRVRRIVIEVALSGCILAQIPAGLDGRLHDKNFQIRVAAVKEAAGITPTPFVTAAQIAGMLATALEDKDIAVRREAAAQLGKPWPADVAAPALVRALKTADKDFAVARRSFARDDAGQKVPPESSREENDAVLYALTFADAVLTSLGTYRDQRAAEGLIAAVKGWKMDRVPGLTFVKASQVLCAYGSRAALEAVADTLARAEVAMRSPPDRIPPGPNTLGRGMRVMMHTIEAKQTAEIVAALEGAAATAGLTKPAGFDPSSAGAWKTLLKASSKQLPERVEASAAASRPATRPG